jgi:hypothetical protein
MNDWIVPLLGWIVFCLIGGLFVSYVGDTDGHVFQNWMLGGG